VGGTFTDLVVASETEVEVVPVAGTRAFTSAPTRWAQASASSRASSR
jgi:N-methylhydantoinase A/oxoprolinase/acetone carboxylase beta subunit